ncbi:two-component sensor histidine kinase [Mangrovactinospora gilvigrisea]|uniref:histidine kinase n=1 Tax=Mangrovactinospora gilvigrisea TaxID=1428644 RepID=A0A1J7BBL6_9ACTN|nr:two-component sensor histidine kinase [Mangrovactinospora gilvigrisea]
MLRGERRRRTVVRPVLGTIGVVGTAVMWPGSRILYPSVALPLFVLTALAAVVVVPPRVPLARRQLLVATTAFLYLGALLLPLAHATAVAPVLPYVGAAAVGERYASRRAALGVGASAAVVAALGTLLVEHLQPSDLQWPWWVALTVGLPVNIGMAARDRHDALTSARRAAEEARRATDSEAREAALLERGRIAREIHDVLGHSLSGIAVQLDLAAALHVRGRDEEAAAAAGRARALAVDSIGETRRAVHALREGTPPLSEALRRLAEHGTVRLSVEVADGEDVDDLGADATHAVLRAAQEGLTNAAKYAPGAERRVRLEATAARVVLAVENGPATREASPELAVGGGTGLASMRERAELLGGTLAAGPAPDGGWTVRLELPR